MDGDASPRRAPAACPHFDPLDPAFASDPSPGYAALRHEAPVVYDEKLGIWLVSRYDDVMTALKEPDTLSSRGALLAAGQFPPAGYRCSPSTRPRTHRSVTRTACSPTSNTSTGTSSTGAATPGTIC